MYICGSKGQKDKSQAFNHCRHEATPRLLDLMDGWVDIIRNLSELVRNSISSSLMRDIWINRRI